MCVCVCVCVCVYCKSQIIVTHFNILIRFYQAYDSTMMFKKGKRYIQTERVVVNLAGAGPRISKILRAIVIVNVYQNQKCA